MVFVIAAHAAALRKSRFVWSKVVRHLLVQAPITSNKNMGGSYSKSYSPCKNPCSSVPGNTGTITRMDSSNFGEQYVEAVVCNSDDLKDNEMKVFEIGEEGRVLLVKQKGVFSAVGTKCTHYGAPLVKGVLGEGRIRCPWHGACFSLKSGDIEDFPGFDSLPCYQVSVSMEGEVKVRAKITDLQENVRTKPLSRSNPCDCSKVVVIAGGGPSGATCAETLRAEGFKGRIIVVAKEHNLPYDRTKVSKLARLATISNIQVRSKEYYEQADIEFLTGTEVLKVDPKDRVVYLSNGNQQKYQSLYVATGCKPRVPDIPGINQKNIFTIRNYEDHIGYMRALGEDRDKNIVILGLGFIGLEVAALFADRAQSVTVVGTNSLPLGSVFDADIGEALRKLFESKKVNFKFNCSITRCIGDAFGITSVVISDGSELPADMLILGVGTTFYTDFLTDTGIKMESNGAISVNEYLETSIKGIYAGGDIAHAPVYAAVGKHMTIGHVGLAQYHGKMAALNILKKKAALRTIPYFWAVFFAKSIRYAGCGEATSSLVDGSVEDLQFVKYFFDESDRVIAVASCSRDPIVSQFAERLYQGRWLYKNDLGDDFTAWTKTSNDSSPV